MEGRLKLAKGEPADKVSVWKKLQRAKNEIEVTKTTKRPRRYVSAQVQLYGLAGLHFATSIAHHSCV